MSPSAEIPEPDPSSGDDKPASTAEPAHASPEETLPSPATEPYLGKVLSSESAGQLPGPLPAIPGYDVVSELGRGGMGVVFRALQVELKRTVALER